MSTPPGLEAAAALVDELLADQPDLIDVALDLLREAADEYPAFADTIAPSIAWLEQRLTTTATDTTEGQAT